MGGKLERSDRTVVCGSPDSEGWREKEKKRGWAGRGGCGGSFRVAGNLILGGGTEQAGKKAEGGKSRGGESWKKKNGGSQKRQMCNEVHPLSNWRSKGVGLGKKK